MHDDDSDNSDDSDSDEEDEPARGRFHCGVYHRCDSLEYQVLKTMTKDCPFIPAQLKQMGRRLPAQLKKLGWDWRCRESAGKPLLVYVPPWRTKDLIVGDSNNSRCYIPLATLRDFTANRDYFQSVPEVVDYISTYGFVSAPAVFDFAMGGGSGGGKSEDMQEKSANDSGCGIAASAIPHPQPFSAAIA